MKQIKFVSNYPHYNPEKVGLLPTPERVGALSDYTGRGVTIAFIDSGFSMHPDVADRIIAHADASTNRVLEQPHVMEITDMSWHGQMTSVIAAGDGRTSAGVFKGIASESNLIFVKVSTPKYQIKENDILRGLRWIYDSRKRYNVRVVNVSVGGDFENHDANHPLHLIVKKLHDVGITVVIAAGNSGKRGIVPPASSPHALTVGGYDDHNQIDRHHWKLYRHSHGMAYDGTHKPEILGLADWVASPILPNSKQEREIGWLSQMLHIHTKAELKDILEKGYADLGFDDDIIHHIDDELVNKLQGRIYHHKIVDAHHQYVDGTSVSTPIVTAIIAQMLQANPNLSPQDIRQILTSTATKLHHVADEIQGAGIVNAKQAVMTAQTWSTTRTKIV
ncbi:MAG: S8 family serine peptidase [bacterium]|nr:S8 family serine peptidase [bacterium]